VPPRSRIADPAKEAEAASLEAGATAEQGRIRALDPALSSAEVARARRDMEDVAFGRDRLQVAVQKLGDRLKELQRREENQRRQIACDRVKAERDTLADELARLYPPVAAQLAELLARVEANNREVEYTNKRLPMGSGEFLIAELVARGFRGFVESWVDLPSITRKVRLPSFERSVHEPYAWPRSL
jgi:hypothetical protein